MRFGDLYIGDMFNTMVGRYVKTSETEAICVMSAIDKLGQICTFNDSTNIVVLWSANKTH